MPSILPAELKTYLAWRFESVLPGSFRRKKADFAHHEYPILAPLPTSGRHTPALEPSALGGPYVYFICDSTGAVRYVGKSLEDQVIQRWVRPGVGGPAKHYWTHSTKSGGAVFEIAKGLQSDAAMQYQLRYLPIDELSELVREQLGLNQNWTADKKTTLQCVEEAFIKALQPDWNQR